ncbi:MAG: hypothetical protein N2506_06965 [Dehalococcoidales bacterium]|nr:hypothetical protein [Dehalococcoidales bacterium]
MGLLASILAGIGAIAAALGIVSILEVSPTPILSAKFTWEFWFYLAIILFLGAIASLLGNRPGQD